MVLASAYAQAPLVEHRPTNEGARTYRHLRHPPTRRPLTKSPDGLEVEMEWTSVELLSGTWHVRRWWGCPTHLQQLPDPLFPREAVLSEGLDAVFECLVEDLDQPILSWVVDG